MLTITTNVASLNTQRSLAKNTQNLASTFERLSTGLRINSAKDDAAGLAISERFTSQIRGLNQAVRNANDAVSLIRTAETALNETTSNLQRIRELAVQSANDTNTASDRAALQQEVNQLLEEIDRVAVQSHFNDRKLLDGSYTGAVFQVGAFASETITVNIRSSRIFNLGNEATVTTGRVSGDALAAGDFTLNGVRIPETRSEDDPVHGDPTSAIAKVAAVNRMYAATGVSAEVQPNVVNLGSITPPAADVTFNLNGSAIRVEAGTTVEALRNTVNAYSRSTGVVAEVTDSGQMTLTAVDGRNVTITGAPAAAVFAAPVDAIPADGTFRSTVRFVSDDGFTVGGANPAFMGTVDGAPTTINRAIADANISTRLEANDVITLMDVALRQINSEQARLGALLNRLDASVSSLSSTSENLSAARSRVRDADFAAETAEFSKNQILQQASTAMLAQANVSGQIALTLLGG